MTRQIFFYLNLLKNFTRRGPVVARFPASARRERVTSGRGLPPPYQQYRAPAGDLPTAGPVPSCALPEALLATPPPRVPKFFSGFYLVIFFSIICSASNVFAFPDKERQPGGSLTEPPFSFVTAQVDAFVLSPDDRFLVAGTGTAVKVIDTQTWAVYGTQVPAFSSSTSSTTDADIDGNVKGLTFRSDTQLWISQDDGDLLRYDSTDFATLVTKIKLSTKSLGALAPDTESGIDDDKIYVTSPAGTSLFVFDVSDQKGTELPIKNSKSEALTPTDVVFAAFPTTAAPNITADKIFVATSAGEVMVLTEGGSTFASIDIDSKNKDNLSALALSPERNLLFVLDATDSTVFVVDTATLEVLDTDGNTANGVTPIALATTATPPVAVNSSLKDLVVTHVSHPSDTYLYVSGAAGLSIIDLDITATAFTSYKILDMGTTSADNEPLPMSSPPGTLVATSAAVGNIYSSDSNAKISIISDNPFVTATTDLSGSVGPAGSFNISLQSDEVGTFILRSGGNFSATGTQLTFTSGSTSATSGTVSTVNTANTATVSYAAQPSAFTEGTNRIFIFVADAGGSNGWDALDVTVDTPPPAVTIVGEAFGTGTAVVTFNRLTQADMAQYNIYAGSTAAAALAAASASATVAQPASGERVSATVGSLTNGVAVFLAVEAQDKAGNKSATRTVSNSITPEKTVGLVGILAEGGCTLLRR